MYSLGLLARWPRIGHLIVTAGLLAGCTSTTGTSSTDLKGSENISLSTYAPPDAPIRKTNSWPRLVDARRGLWAQHPKVRVKCLKPDLISLLGKIERRFGKKVIITSGYRSPTYNRRVRGAKRSKHMSCEAADISIPGVSKWTLAKYVRSLPGRGGVGTYCRSRFVHVDVGDKRDWNWRCRKRRRKTA